MSNNLWKTLTSSIVCEWTKKKHLGWIAKYVERFTTRINKFASKRLVWKQLQLIKMTGNLCHGVLAHFVVIANFASLCAMDLKVYEETTCNEKNTASFPTNVLSTHYIKRYKQHKRTFKKLFNRQTSFQKLTISIRFNFVYPFLLFYLLCN